MSDYSFRRISEDNLDDYITIFSQVFSSTPSKEQVAQKFEYDEIKQSYLGFIAYDNNNQAAAFYGVYTCKYSIDGALVTCAQSGSTMTLAAHRGKGLFVSLARRTYELAQEQGIQFIFGMPNPFSYHGLKHSLKWTFTHQMRAAVLFLPSLRLLSFYRYKEANTYFRDERETALNEHQQFKFFEKAKLGSADAAKFQVQTRFRPLENYKDKPGFLLIRNNIAIWVKMNLSGSLSVGDVFVLPNARPFEAVIFFALFCVSCLVEGIPKLSFYYSPNSEVAKYFGFPWIKRKSLHFGFLNLGSNADLPTKLQITYGDYDTF